MQSWSYVNGGKGLASNEMISPSDSVAKTKNAFIGWDLETANSSSFGNTFENQGFGDLSSEKMNPFMDTFSLEANSNSRRSCSAVNSNKRASSYIDLKLGRFGDPEETRDSRISKERSIFSVSESSKPAKRVRLGVNFQHSRCQVYGCNKDLTSSKEYHRRHKVCEVHSKTSKVIVNGIEQRFCQQCSRFHLLKEFDDGKRSCRKRLAGHNERRRKPQVGIHSGRTGRLVQSNNGFGTSSYNGTSLTSFICEDILPNVPLQLEKSGRQNWYRNIKVEDCSNFSLQSSIPITNGHLNPKPVFDSNNLDKAFLGFHVNEAATPTGTTIFNESPNRYTCNLAGSNEEFDGFDSVQGLSGITNSSCALSLLSSQLLLGSNSHYSVSEVSEKLLGVSSTSGMSNKGNHFGSSALISNGFDDVINFDGPDGFCQGSNFKDQDDTTIDLLELSSQLQRVEWQKQSMQVKQENDAMYWRHVT